MGRLWAELLPVDLSPARILLLLYSQKKCYMSIETKRAWPALYLALCTRASSFPYRSKVAHLRPKLQYMRPNQHASLSLGENASAAGGQAGWCHYKCFKPIKKKCFKCRSPTTTNRSHSHFKFTYQIFFLSFLERKIIFLSAERIPCFPRSVGSRQPASHTCRFHFHQH